MLKLTFASTSQHFNVSDYKTSAILCLRKLHFTYRATLLSENIMKHVLFTTEFGRLRTIARKGANKLPYRISKIQFAVSEARNVGYW